MVLSAVEYQFIEPLPLASSYVSVKW